MTENIYLHPFVLQRIHRLIEEKGIINYKLDLTPGAAPGDNYLGTIIKATVDGVNQERNEQITLNWIVKCAALADAVRKYIQVDRLFKREIYFYERLIPLFRDLQSDHELFEPFASIPELYLRCTETYQESLVLEDMKSLGFTNVNRQKPLNLSHVVLVMKAYGKLHALSYALRQQYPEEFKKIVEDFKEKQNTNVNIEDISSQLKHSCSRALETLSLSKDRNIIQTFKKFMERSFELQVETVKLGAIGPHAVFSHGDAVVTNLLFKYDNLDNPNVPTNICLLDWQFARYGSPALDLSNFLFTATDKNFRDIHYDQMIRVYHYELCSYLTELGEDPEKLIPFNILELQLKRYSVYGLCTTLLMLHLIMSHDDDAPIWNGDVTAEDIRQTFEYKTKNYDEYQIRIHDVVNDFIEYGYLDFLN